MKKAPWNRAPFLLVLVRLVCRVIGILRQKQPQNDKSQFGMLEVEVCRVLVGLGYG